MNQREANLFFHLINHLYERSSIILTSNKSPDQWTKLMGDEGKLDEAEEELINYYFDRERIDFLIRRLIYFKDFQPRKDLFQKALDDHFNERFNSSVPIFLMMIGGFVSDM